MSLFVFFCYGYADHRDLHVLTHSFPPLRSSDLLEFRLVCRCPEPVPLALQGSLHFAQALLQFADGLFLGGNLLDDLRPQSDRGRGAGRIQSLRSEEHTSELQSLMRISYAVFCLKKKT